MILRITEAAGADIREAIRWFREQSEGLEFEFLRSLDQCLSLVHRNPNAYARVHGVIRRALLRRFPFAVFFVVEELEIVVLGVFHGHCDPTIWRG